MKTTLVIVAALGLLFSIGCSPKSQAEKDAEELKKISKTAAQTCGSMEQVDSVSLEGFVCKD